MGRVYKTMQGREIDMDKIMAKNELMPAVGNLSVNARGDQIGYGGKIIKTKEEMMSDYYENNPKALNNKTNLATEDKITDSKQLDNRGKNDSKRKN